MPDMCKVIEFPFENVPVRWLVLIREGEEYVNCQYIEYQDSYVQENPYWLVSVTAATVGRLQCLLTEAEKLLAKKMSARRAVLAQRDKEGEKRKRVMIYDNFLA